MATKVDLTDIPEHNDTALNFAISKDGSPADLTGLTVEVFIKADPSDDDETKSQLKLSSTNPNQITLTDAPNGKVRVFLTAAQTQWQLARVWKCWKLDLVAASGARGTAMYGDLAIINT